MDGLLEKIFDNNDQDSLRTVIEEKGFKPIYRGNASYGDIKFDDSVVLPQHLILIGYDKDLDLSFQQLVASYQQKEENDSVTIYTQPLDDILHIVGPKLHKVQTSGGEVELPSIYPCTRFVILPFQRKDIPLVLTIYREVTIPAELLNPLYLSEDTNLESFLAPLLGISADESNETNDNSSCSGRITMPIALFTGKGKNSTEYIFTVDDLEADIEAQRRYVKDNKTDHSLRRSLLHAQTFINKYKALLPKSK